MYIVNDKNTQTTFFSANNGYYYRSWETKMVKRMTKISKNFTDI